MTSCRLERLESCRRDWKTVHMSVLLLYRMYNGCSLVRGMCCITRVLSSTRPTHTHTRPITLNYSLLSWTELVPTNACTHSGCACDTSSNAVIPICGLTSSHPSCRHLPLPDKLVYLQPLLRNPHRKLPNSVKLRGLRAIKPFMVIQGHRVWYQLKAHMRLPISH